MTYTVAVLIEDRAFGGYEEGGWWFDYGEVCLDFKPKRFKTIDKAYGHLNKLNKKLKYLNSQRPYITEVNCQGVFKAYVFSGKPKGYPDSIPHYN